MISASTLASFIIAKASFLVFFIIWVAFAFSKTFAIIYPIVNPITIPIIILGYAENIRSQKIVIENKQAKYKPLTCRYQLNAK